MKFLQQIFLTNLLCLTYSLKVLVINPEFGHSHTKFMQKLSETLATAGHTVVELSVVPVRLPKPRTSSTVKIIHIDIQEEARETGEALLHAMSYTWYDKGMNNRRQTVTVSNALAAACDYTLRRRDILEELKRENFDLAIAEVFSYCAQGIIEILGIKQRIAASSSILYEHIARDVGAPIMPSFIPCGQSELGDEMDFLQRATNIYDSLYANMMFDETLAKETEVFAKHNFNFDLRELVSKSSLVVTNAHPFLEFPRPLPSKVISVGGIDVKLEKQELTTEWDNVLNRKPRTVLISFGSLAPPRLMPLEYKKGIMETTRRLPDVQFIWKYDEDKIEGLDLPSNLLLSKWIPQHGLLNDERVALFITHGGYASSMEIIYSGTPAIVVPLFGDQGRNAQMLQKNKIAKALSKFDLANEEKFFNTVTELLNEPKYQRRAKDLAELTRSLPFNQSETFLKNVEFVTRFGDLLQLEPTSQKLNLVQYLLLDVIFLALFIVLIVFFILHKTLIFISSRLLGRISKKSKSA